MKRGDIAAIIGDRPIAYHPLLARAIKSVAAAIFLGQLLYWQGKGKYGDWTYKSQDEIYEETGLGRSSQETARRKLKAIGILDEKLAGVPATMHYRVDVDNLEDKLSEYVENRQASMRESSNLDCGNAADRCAENQQTIKAETTHSITTKNTQRADPDFSKAAKTSRQRRFAGGEFAEYIQS